MLYCPPLTEIAEGMLVPDTVMLLEVQTVFRGALFTGLKLKGFGILDS